MVQLSVSTLLIIIFLTLSCSQNSQQNSLEILSKETQDTHKEPFFEINNCRFHLEIAKTVNERSQGLMNRNELPENRAMLFIFENEDYLNFWMKNTYIHLDILFLSKNFEILDIQSMQPQKLNSNELLPIYTSIKPAKYAIELNSGLLKKCKIEVGEIAIIPHLQ